MSKLYPCVYCTEDGHCKKFSDDEVTSWCVQGPCEEEKPSNGDRIRAMTDEELAYLFISIGDGNTPEKMVFSARDIRYEQKMWLDWLKQGINDGRSKI